MRFPDRIHTIFKKSFEVSTKLDNVEIEVNAIDGDDFYCYRSGNWTFRSMGEDVEIQGPGDFMTHNQATQQPAPPRRRNQNSRNARASTFPGASLPRHVDGSGSMARIAHHYASAMSSDVPIRGLNATASPFTTFTSPSQPDSITGPRTMHTTPAPRSDSELFRAMSMSTTPASSPPQVAPMFSNFFEPTHDRTPLPEYRTPQSVLINGGNPTPSSSVSSPPRNEDHLSTPAPIDLAVSIQTPSGKAAMESSSTSDRIKPNGVAPPLSMSSGGSGNVQNSISAFPSTLLKKASSPPSSKRTHQSTIEPEKHHWRGGEFVQVEERPVAKKPRRVKNEPTKAIRLDAFPEFMEIPAILSPA